MPLLSIAAGVAALLLMASYLGHFLYVPGGYRELPWAHLAGVPLLCAAAVAALRVARRDPRWPRRVAAWIGVVAGAVATFILWSFVFLGARLPALPRPDVRAAAPFTLPDQDGRMVRSRELSARGPVVLVFYRGAFDRYALAALSDLEGVRARVEQAGGRVVAVSGDPAGESRAVRARLHLGYPLLVDADLAVARAFAVADAAGGTAHPAVFVLAPGGGVRLVHFPASARDFAAPDEIVEIVAALAVSGPAAAPAP